MRLVLSTVLLTSLLGCTKPTAQGGQTVVTTMSGGLGGGVLAYEVSLSANAVARELRNELTVTTNGNAEGLEDPTTTTTVVFGLNNDIEDDELTYVETSSPDGSRSSVELDLDLDACTEVGHSIDTEDSCLVDFVFLSQAPTVRSGISVSVKLRGFASEDWTGDPEAADLSVEWFEITNDVVAQGE